MGLSSCERSPIQRSPTRIWIKDSGVVTSDTYVIGVQEVGDSLGKLGRWAALLELQRYVE